MAYHARQILSMSCFRCKDDAGTVDDARLLIAARDPCGMCRPRAQNQPAAQSHGQRFEAELDQKARVAMRQVQRGFSQTFNVVTFRSKYTASNTSCYISSSYIPMQSKGYSPKYHKTFNPAAASKSGSDRQPVGWWWSTPRRCCCQPSWWR